MGWCVALGSLCATKKGDRHKTNDIVYKGYMQHNIMHSLYIITLCSGIGCTKPELPEKVIVVGAGISGLTVAKSLHENGVEVVVLEARDRIGGRTNTIEVADVLVDEGAAWFHGNIHNPLVSLSNQVGIDYNYHDLEEDVWYYDAQAGEISDTILDAADDAVADFTDEVYDVVGQELETISVHDALSMWLDSANLSASVERTTRFFIEQGAIEIDLGGPATRTSLLASLEQEELLGGDYLPEGGYASVIDVLSEGVDVHTSAVVTRVSAMDDGVEVQTDTDSFYASHVVVTVPLGVLQSGMIDFIPALPTSKQHSMSHLEMGNLEKVILRFEEQFWANEGLKGISWLDHVNGELTGVFPEILDVSSFTGQPTLIGFYGGSRARADQGNIDDTEIVAQLLHILSVVLDRDIPTPIGSYVTHWTIDPYSLGSYSFIPTEGSVDDMEELSQPIANGRILFAGEATYMELYQTAHGAMLSGLREAKRLGVQSTGIPGLDRY